MTTLGSFVPVTDPGAWAKIAAAQAAGGSAVGTDGVIATFYQRHVIDEAQTEVQGKVVTRSKVYVKIQTPADRNNVIDDPARDDHYQRFPEAWQRYETRQQGVGGGTPLDQTTWVGPLQLAILDHLKIKTVEHLAQIDHSMIKKIGEGGQRLVAKARQHLEGDDQAIQDLRAENQTMRREASAAGERALQDQTRLEALEGAMAKMSAPKRRGRPPKKQPAPATGAEAAA